MLAYASDRRRLAERRPAPQAMLFILVGHIAVIAMVMSAKMAVPTAEKPTPTKVDLIELPKPPEPPKPQPVPPKAQPQPMESVVDTPPRLVPVPLPNQPPVDSRPLPIPNTGTPTIGPGSVPPPRIEPVLPPAPSKPVRVGPRFATPDHALRPPYPSSKIASDEEAVLRLRLSIDARGRVTAVESVGPADPDFLASARRHLIAKWRYQPATEDGRAIASSTVISLRFELD